LQVSASPLRRSPRLIKIQRPPREVLRHHA
jgi:hypothetical protein